jgi:hypothetical protein
VNVKSSRSLIALLNLGYDIELPQVAYITNDGVYLDDSSSDEISFSKMKYQDSGVARMFNTDIGVAFQKTSYPY